MFCRVALLFDTSFAFDRAIIRGIAKFILFNRSWILFRQSPYERWQNSQMPLKEQLIKWKPDGIIARETDNINDLFDLNIPLIVSPVSEPFPDYTNIVSDNFAIGAIAAEYFINKGYTNFGYCGLENYKWVKERYEGFYSKINKSEHKFLKYKRQNIKEEGNWENEQQAISVWLTFLPKPFALLCCTDEVAYQVVQAAKLVNILIPEEIAVIGVDNDEFICNICNPQLSSIDQNAELLGYEAAKKLQELMSGIANENAIILVPPKNIITRRSSNILAVEDRNLQKALNYIASNTTTKIIKVDEVVASTYLSRRTLENRFQTILKRSIKGEIIRMKIETIKQILGDKQFNISEVASVSGFPSTDSFCHYFKEHTGITPGTYREKIL